MIVEPQCARFDSIALDGGATLSPVEVAYETYGHLNARPLERHPDYCTLSPATRMPPASARRGKPGGGTT